MIEDLFSSPEVWRRLRDGPLGPYVDGFAALLSECGYARYSIRHRVGVAGQLNRWMKTRGLGVKDLDAALIGSFLDCRNRHQDMRWGIRAGLRLFLKLVSDVCGGADTEADSQDAGELNRIESDFAFYLSNERGLAPATLLNYLPVVRRFLSERFAAGTVALDGIVPPDVTGFVLRRARTMAPKRAQLMTTALRVFFRYLFVRGDVPVDLAGCVPTVAQWRLSSLPKSLDPAQVELVLAACDRTTGFGRRDYAILLLLARLGLRAGEVVSLVLDNLDWDRGELSVKGKGGQNGVLPIPADVGEAISAYLCHGRPTCRSRRLFIRTRAPLCGFSGSAAVDDVVRRALVRAGLDPPRKGAHMLRHSLAVRMLRNGASLTEIGEILRHSVVTSTEIYAKVDIGALGALAQPWPGGDA